MKRPILPTIISASLFFTKVFVSALFSVFLTTFPAIAGRLVKWELNSSQNRFTFNTSSRVQPKAQLLTNPTRIVIDLPGTNLNIPTVRKPVGGKVKEIRISEINQSLTRIVMELNQSYTADPQRVKVRGITSTEWVVELPIEVKDSLTPQKDETLIAQSCSGTSLKPTLYASVITEGDLNVRSSPGGSILYTLERGYVVEVLGGSPDGQWVSIWTTRIGRTGPGEQNWVLSKYLRILGRSCGKPSSSVDVQLFASAYSRTYPPQQSWLKISDSIPLKNDTH